MAILRMSTVFAYCANQLPPEEKMKLPKIFMLLTDNPGHPSLRLCKIEGARRTNIYECRLDASWRIILQRTGETTYDLIYVGMHDEAIRYGAALREPDPDYGYGCDGVERVRRYLAGADEAVEFLPVTEADIEAWRTPGNR